MIRVFVQGLICNETEDFQGLVYKNRKRFGSDYASPKRKRILPEGASRKRFERESREANGGVPLVRFKCSNGAAEFAGAREPRWSPAAIHGEAERSESTSVLRVPFRVS